MKIKKNKLWLYYSSQ